MWNQGFSACHVDDGFDQNMWYHCESWTRISSESCDKFLRSFMFVLSSDDVADPTNIINAKIVLVQNLVTHIYQSSRNGYLFRSTARYSIALYQLGYRWTLVDHLLVPSLVVVKLYIVVVYKDVTSNR